MKICTALAFALLLGSVPICPGAELGGEEDGRPRKEGSVSKIPASVERRAGAAGFPSYIVSGIFVPPDDRRPKNPTRAFEAFFPAFKSVEIDWSGRKCMVSTTRDLSMAELADGIDAMAKQGGFIPYWAELEARDLGSSESAKDFGYLIEKIPEAVPDRLAWFTVSRDRAFQLPINLAGSMNGGFSVTPLTAFCMCHSRYTLRVLDPEGRVIWKDDSTTAGSLRIAVAAGASGHEVYLKQSDHGQDACFVLRQKTSP